jgi:hypothetical protein
MERYLNQIENDKQKENLGGLQGYVQQTFTGFDLLCDVLKIKTFLNLNSTLVNIVLLNRQSGIDLINTWDNKTGAATLRGGDQDMQSVADSFYTYES